MMLGSSSALLLAAATKPDVGYGTLAALILFIVASMWIGILANRAMQSASFMKGFFIGNKGLGAWALALTATVQSGGTFMGFPSLVYTHGWAVALWICGYMVVPMTGFGVLGKRLAQLSRRTGAITVPDLFRARFNSPGLGLLASLLILFYMSFMMVAQFKAGALVMKLAWPGSGILALSEDAVGGIDKGYYVGLAIFTVTVVGYTLLGGFLAAVWTDLFQSVMMLIGVVLLLALALSNAGGLQGKTPKDVEVGTPRIIEEFRKPPNESPIEVATPKATEQPSTAMLTSPSMSPLEIATRKAIEQTGPNFAFGPGYDPTGKGREFLPISLAFSFFWVWVYAGIGSPAGMVRVMAGKNTEVIRKSIYLLSVYNGLIYIPLVVVCICGRAIIPDLPPGKTDEIIPRLALTTTANLPGGSFIAGLILAAPFGAVMATVSSYLVVIASGLVRDVYQRFINPGAGTHELRRLSYLVMIIVGAIAVAANIKPVAYLQAIVVFSGTSSAATFCVAALMVAFWRRANIPGVAAAMITGGGTMLVLYVIGFVSDEDPMIGQVTSFRPYFLLGLDPLVWGLVFSSIVGVAVTLCNPPIDESLVSKMFDAEPAK